MKANPLDWPVFLSLAKKMRLMSPKGRNKSCRSCSRVFSDRLVTRTVAVSSGNSPQHFMTCQPILLWCHGVSSNSPRPLEDIMDSPFLEPPSLMDGGTYLPCVPPAIFALSTPGAPPACWASSSAFSSPWLTTQRNKPQPHNTIILPTHTYIAIKTQYNKSTGSRQVVMACSYRTRREERRGSSLSL
ncbi:hypothetical protein E2C01_013817 [Portunus trituberculatus]|uniref:Uncharacterized protein n=1 Tax=Portunus trituberculatus TaxID=210409 RepID=A0A5B7DIF8_PORTR|nr:hypothetical protein [Portunus trituberculatus]